ncbi:MAG: hypothetical protein R3E95_19860 [Thiolinea sp.]
MNDHANTDHPKRALSYRQAKEQGLIHVHYAAQGLPPEFNATLEYKVWGRSQNLNLYFKTDDGEHYLLSTFSNRKSGADRKYPPKRMPDFDLSDVSIQPGMRFRLVTEPNSRGFTNFLEAHVLA